MINKKLPISCPACGVDWGGEIENLGGVGLCLCSGCGLWFCDPSKLSEVDYDEVYGTVEYQKEMFEGLDSIEDWIKFSRFPTYIPFFREIEKLPDSRLLDIGCGVGRFCRAAYSHGWNVKGIDVSGVAIKKGNEKARFPMVEMTAQEVRNSGERFDVVTSFEVLEHLISPIELVRVAGDLLKPGGKFFCTVPNIASLTVRSSDRRDWLPPVHVLYFTEIALRELLKQAGFKDIRSGAIFVNTPPASWGLKRAKYYIKRLAGRINSPDPLGLWAVGSK